MLVTDGQGIPLAVHLDSAQIHELDLAQITLDKVSVKTPSGRVRKRPDQIVADKGYDARRFRKYLRQKGMRICIPGKRQTGRFRKKGRPYKVDKAAYKSRWKIERTFAWIGNFKRLVLRYENSLSVYYAFFHIACMLISMRALLK